MLTKNDIQFLRQKLAPEVMTYMSHDALGKLRPNEKAHLEYMTGLADRLSAAEASATE